MTNFAPVDCAMQKSPASPLNGMSVSRETAERLQRFIAIFTKWASTINLVAPSTMKDMWERHIADSAQIFHLSSQPGTWMDLGSGGGFPGIITAIFLAETNSGWVHLVESNHKKAAFLRSAVVETGARATVHAARIEAAGDLVSECDFVSARALADLDMLLGYIHPWSARNPQLVSYLHKGRDYQSEIEISRRRWEFDLVKHDSLIEAGSKILEISHLSLRS